MVSRITTIAAGGVFVGVMTLVIVLSVINGFETELRQRIVAFEDGQKDDGTRCCRIMLDPELVAVKPTPRRAFQGWRYLEAADAPADLDRAVGNQLAAMPAQMRRELAELCLI